MSNSKLNVSVEDIMKLSQLIKQFAPDLASSILDQEDPEEVVAAFDNYDGNDDKKDNHDDRKCDLCYGLKEVLEGIADDERSLGKYIRDQGCALVKFGGCPKSAQSVAHINDSAVLNLFLAIVFEFLTIRKLETVCECSKHRSR